MATNQVFPTFGYTFYMESSLPAIWTLSFTSMATTCIFAETSTKTSQFSCCNDPVK